LDLGDVKATCNSPERTINLYNVCATPVTVASAWLETTPVAVGVAGCPGPQRCPEFFITGLFPSNAVLQPGAMPLSVRVKYRPLDLGPDDATLHVQTSEGTYLVSLRGAGTVSGTFTDVFIIDPVPRADVLVMVDASPSFVSKRAGVRENLRQLMRHAQSRCTDVRWRLAAAEGAPGSTPSFLSTDAGQTSFRPYADAGELEAALAALDGMPVGSEVEACIGPAVRLLSDAGAVTGPLTGLCVTDALEQTPDASGAFADFGALAAPSSWSVVGAKPTSSCAVESVDDGVHQSLAARGVWADICEPDWWTWFTWSDPLTPCGARSRYYLSQTVLGGNVQVAVDGVRVPGGGEDGGTPAWRYDAASNSVSFEPAFAPQPGSTITITADVACP
jgi:hypothetical protein